MNFKVKSQQLFSVIAFIASSFLFGQIEFIAKPNKKEVSVNEKFSVHFFVQVEGANANFTVDEYLKLPDLKKFRALGVSDTHNSMFSNGKSITQSGQMIYLVAEKEGNYTIGSATIKINGKVYKTDPIKIHVGKNIKPKKEGGKRINGAFLTAELSNQQPYLNEATILSVKMYARDYSVMNRKQDFQTPDFKGFAYKKLESDSDGYNQEMVDNKVYISQELARYAIFPNKSGTVKLEPFSIDIILSNFYTSERIQLTTDEIKIKAKPLPAGKPKNFNGAVGNFTLRTDVDKKKLDSNESLTVDVELIGSGNLNMIELPELSTPKEIEVYKPKKREKILAKKNGLKGKLAFEYILVPQYGGDYKIDPIEFSFFNPEKEKYEQISTDEIVLEVSGNPPPIPKKEVKKEEPKVAENNNSEKRKSEQLEDSQTENLAINDSNEQETQDDSIAKNILKSPWLWAVSGTSLLLLLLFAVRLGSEKRKKTKSSEFGVEKPTVREKRAETLARLKTLDSLVKQNDANQFYKDLGETLSDLGMYFTDLGLAEFTPKAAKTILLKKQSENTTNDWERLLLKSKENQYSPYSNPTDLKETLVQTKDLVDDLFRNHYES